MNKIFACLLALCLLPLSLSHGADADSEYLKVFGMIEQADALAASGKTDQAMSKYREAHTALLNLKRAYPAWNPKMVTYRMNYVVGKITTLSQPAPEQSANAAASPGATSAGKASGGPANYTIKLLESGAEPRSQLRFAPNPGQEQTVTMTIRTAMDMKMGENAVPGTKLPPIRIQLNTAVKEVTPDGQITYEMVVKEADVPEGEASSELAAVAQQAIGGMKGLAATGRMTDRGLVQSTEVKGPGGAAAGQALPAQQLKDMFAQLAAPLPEEPVGLGAKWQATFKSRSQGVTLDQTSTFEIISLQDTAVGIRSSVTQTAPKQKVENPAMPGLKLDLTRMTGKGSGEMMLDLGHVLPVSGKMKSQGDMAMSMNMGGQPQAMSTVINVEVLLESR